MKASRLILLMVLTAASISCGGSDPIRIGYVAALSGRLSQLGVDGRNGVEMAAEEWNDDGGVNGRPVEIVLRDDESTPDVGVRVVNELIQGVDVDAIIGPLTSNMLPAVQAAHDAGILIFSPIMSTSQLTGLDDHFVRANLTLGYQAAILAEKMSQDGVDRTSIVYDVSNPQYTEEFVAYFQSAFRARGGSVSMDHSFDSAANPDYVLIADEIAKDQSPAVVFVTTGIDAGAIAQQLWKQSVPKELYAAEWAKTTDITSVGGRAVNEMVLATQFIPDEPTLEYEKFRRGYREMYGSAPSFSAQYAYETANILLEAIDRAGSTELHELKRHIVGQTHEGLVEQIEIDSYGDAMRTAAVAQIRDGQFIIETLTIDNE